MKCKLNLLLSKILDSKKGLLYKRFEKLLHDTNVKQLIIDKLDNDIKSLTEEINYEYAKIKELPVDTRLEKSQTYKKLKESIKNEIKSLHSYKNIDKLNEEYKIKYDVAKNNIEKSYAETENILTSVTSKKDRIAQIQENKILLKHPKATGSRIIKFYTKTKNKIKDNNLYKKLKFIISIEDDSKRKTELNSLKNDSNMIDSLKMFKTNVDKYFNPKDDDIDISKAVNLINEMPDGNKYKKVNDYLLRVVNAIGDNTAGNRYTIKDNTLLKDITDEGNDGIGFEIISRLFTTTSGGKAIINPEVKNAISIGIVEWLKEQGSNGINTAKSDEMIRKVLSISDPKTLITDEMRTRANIIDGLVANAANGLGSTIYKYIGLKAKSEVENTSTEIIEAKLKTELGLLGLVTLYNAGSIKLYYKNSKDNKEFDPNGDNSLPAEMIFGTKGKPVKAFIFLNGEQRATNKDGIVVNGVNVKDISTTDINNVTEVLTNEKKKHGVYKTAKDAVIVMKDIVNNGISGIVEDVPKIQKEAIQRQSKTAMRFNNRYFKLLTVLAEEDNLNSGIKDDGAKDERIKDMLSNYLGYEDPSTVVIDRRHGVEGANAAIRDNIQNLLDAYREYGEGEMYARWQVITNGRFMIDSNKLNWQDKKLHRHAVYNKKVKLDSEELHNYFILALGQGFGAYIDKESMKTGLKSSNKVIEEVRKKLEEDGPKKAMRFLIDEKHVEPTHAMMSLSELMAYDLHGKDKSTFETGIRIETDAITSGYILKLLQMPLFRDMSRNYEELARGGFTNTKIYKDYNNYGERVETHKYDDSYQFPASTLSNKLDKKIKIVEPNDGEGIKGIISILSNKKFGDLTITRAIMKYPFMTLNYGSAVNTIIDNLVNSTMYGNKIIGTKGIPGIYEALISGKDDVRNDMFAKFESIFKLLAKNSIKNATKEQINNFVSTKIDKLYKMQESDKPLDEHIYNDKNALFTKEEEKSLKLAIKELIKDPVSETFNENYASLITATNTINNMLTTQFRLAKSALDSKIQEELDKRASKLNGKKPAPLTNKEIEGMVKELSDIFPVLNSALKTENGGYGKILIAKYEKKTIQDYNGTNINGYASIREDKSNGEQQLSAGSELYKIVEAYSSGSVIPIHFLDGALQSQVLNMFDATGIHDANYFNLDNVKEGTNLYNQKTYETNKEYGLATEMLKSFVNTLENIEPDGIKMLDKISADSILEQSKKLINKSINGRTSEFNKMIKENIYSLKDIDYKMLKNTFGDNKESIKSLLAIKNKIEGSLIQSQFNETMKLQKLSEDNRYDIFNNPDIAVDHSYFPGSQFIPKKADIGYTKKSVDTSKAVNVLNSVAGRSNNNITEEEVVQNSRQATKSVFEKNNKCKG